jgi:microcystin-dependent protein
MATLLPNVVQQFRDSGGIPLAGGKLFSYAAGTNTLKATFTDQSEGAQNANPTILDGAGMASVWISADNYKFVLKDSLNNVLWTVDNVASIADDSITTPKIADLAITTVKIEDLAVTTAKIAENAVLRGNILDGEIITAKIADQAVTIDKIKYGIGLVPAGCVIAWGGDQTAIPTGYLLCDGTSYLRADYPDLYSAVGVVFGTVDGNHFNVPDGRGYFIRGANLTSTNDPDSATRTAMNPGGAIGNNRGSIQADEFKSHSHSFSISIGTDALNGHEPWGTNGTTDTLTTSSAGGNETRPKNFYMNWIIKT